MRRWRRANFTWFALTGALVLAVAPATARQAVGERVPSDLRVAIEAAHFMVDFDAPPGEGAAIFAPDGRHFAVRVVRADIARDGAWLDLYIGSRSADRWRLRRLRSLFTRGLERPPVYRQILQNDNRLIWLDPQRFAFRWEDRAGIAQVVAIDAKTGQLEYLTRHPTDVIEFSAGPGSSVSYLAQRAIPTQPDDGPYGGTLITAPDIAALLSPVPSLGAIEDRYWREAFTVVGSGPPRRLPFEFARGVQFAPNYAPDGSRFVVEAMVPEIPPDWQAYRRLSGAPPAFLAALSERSIRWAPLTRAMLVDSANGFVRPLWDRPSLGPRATPRWSPSGRHVMLAAAVPTPDRIGDGISLFATIDVASGRVMNASANACDVPIAPGELRFDWITDDHLVAHTDRATFEFRPTPAGWRCAPGVLQPAAAAKRAPVYLRESFESPPALIANTNGQEQVLLDPAPELARLARGRVEAFAIGSEQGWLYFPHGFVAGKRYPLVVQLTGGSDGAERFSLYGMPGGTGLGVADSIYAAQPLAARGIMVLSLPRRYRLAPGEREDEANRQMIEGAIAALEARGLIDATRIGLAGYSRPGWLVSYCLAHSPIEFAAALISDATDAGYLMANVIPEYGEGEIGAAPFGAGLAAWLERAPAFAVDRIRTPLRIHNEMAPGVGRLHKWEMFSRMRRLGLPVEFYEIPDIAHGSHSVQNPRQGLASKAAAIDWFTFWLTGTVDPDPAKRAQYARWVGLKRQRDAQRQKPRPPLLDWHASPLPAQPSPLQR